MTTLRTWLKQAPPPVKVRAWDAEGGERIVRINDAKSRWRDAELSLVGSVKCEAVDRDGEILRTWVDPEHESASIGKSVAGAPKSELAELARIITESNDRAAERNGDAWRTGFEQLVALVKVLSERVQAYERAWHRLIMQNAKSVDGSETEAAPTLGVNEQLILALAPAIAPQLLAAMGLGGTPPAQQNGAPE